MDRITQDIKFRQSAIKYSYRNGVTAASLQYKVNRRTIYRWRERHNGTLKFLVNKSRRPHRSPKAPSKKEVYEPKAYQQMMYPGQRVQVDVKYVPMNCLTKEFYKLRQIL